MNIFSSLTTFQSFCETCQKDVVLNSSILVNFVTRSALQKCELNYNSWSLFICQNKLLFPIHSHFRKYSPFHFIEKAGAALVKTITSIDTFKIAFEDQRERLSSLSRHHSFLSIPAPQTKFCFRQSIFGNDEMCELIRRTGMEKKNLLHSLFDEIRTKMSSYGSYNLRSPSLEEIRV